MNKNKLKTFARAARRKLMQQVRSKLHYVLNTDSAELRDKEKQVRELKDEIRKTSEEEVVEKVAYTWFNRISALRFMDANGYTSIKVVSPAEGHTTPEILAEAKKGFIDENLRTDRDKIHDLLAGRIPARDAQNEVYQLLLVSVCNDYHKIMPFMFEPIDDYTELLMPDDLLSEQAIINEILQNIPDEDCQNVEIIGWLYQFYISEKKDEVFAGLKKNKKIEPEDIPAATQLFTPHWIVRYLVENSLGRLWMMNRPDSRLVEKMDYYIRPEQEEKDFLRISSPEEIKICDPACGSGHMLVYAFDLLCAIYEEEGYDATEIPRLILQNNLYGIEIDERAGELAAFALFMKARGKYRRFFRKPEQPNVCVLENITFTKEEIESYMSEVGGDLFTANMQTTLSQFEEADNFGSLIRPALTDTGQIRQTLEQKNVGGKIFLHDVHQRVLKVLRQADYISPKYHIVVANPPYMGGKGMNGSLREFAQKDYPDNKSDLFAMFIERGFELILNTGYNAMVTMQSWMFLSSYENMRNRLLDEMTIDCMVHMANMVMGIAFGTTATVWHKCYKPDFQGYFSYVYYENLTQENKPCEFPVQNERLATASAADFKKIPGSPIAYWVSDKVREIFNTGTQFEQLAMPRQGLGTTSNDKFTRFWAEVELKQICFHAKNHFDGRTSQKKWFPYTKGGGYRKWFGNEFDLVNWENDGSEIRQALKGKNPNIPRSEKHYFKKGITWGLITSASFSARSTELGAIFDVGGSKAFPKDEFQYSLLGVLNSKPAALFLKTLNPTLNYQVGDLKRIPIKEIVNVSKSTSELIRNAVNISEEDWDSFETSWDFVDLPLFQDVHKSDTLYNAYNNIRKYWRDMTSKMQKCEEENNRILIETYNLEAELKPEVPLKEITLTCNPHYRYGNGRSEEEYEALLLSDTIKELVSYSVGCMLGRYSLDKPGLILANQGQTVADYVQRIGKHDTQITFMPDEDNIIPVLEDDYFTDDISGRFLAFLKITFTEEYFKENLKFIEDAIGKSIRAYFIKDFYADHVKRYKKRPIYWLFSSPKRGFNALIYMHRYRSDTISRLLNEYLREYINKLEARHIQLKNISLSESASVRDRKHAEKEIAKIDKVLKDVREYERTLYQLAAQKIEIDLDDGVKVNYCKFKVVLAPIAGLCS